MAPIVPKPQSCDRLTEHIRMACGTHVAVGGQEAWDDHHSNHSGQEEDRHDDTAQHGRSESGGHTGDVEMGAVNRSTEGGGAHGHHHSGKDLHQYVRDPKSVKVEMAADVGRAMAVAPPVGLREKLRRWQIELFMTLDCPDYSAAARYWGFFMITVIVLACIDVLISTVPALKYTPTTCKNPVCTPGTGSPCTKIICAPEPFPSLVMIEFVTVIIFTVEYIFRILTVHAVPAKELDMDGYIERQGEGATFCPEGKLQGLPEPSGLCKTVTYFFRFMNLIDLVAILPFYVSALVLCTKVICTFRGIAYLPVFTWCRIYTVAHIFFRFMNLIDLVAILPFYVSAC
jgi:hypothetical protein